MKHSYQSGHCFGAVQSMLVDILGILKVSARWVPRMLTDDEKSTWLNISRYVKGFRKMGAANVD